MKLSSETREEYLSYCRQAIIAEDEYLTVMTGVQEQHTALPHDGCASCELLDETIQSSKENIATFTARYERAKQGIDE